MNSMDLRDRKGEWMAIIADILVRRDLHHVLGPVFYADFSGSESLEPASRERWISGDSGIQ
ncbi:hypothetical protein [Rhizobium phaseoli]|uniref:hypothetical protein n=1 Tax=Rhizobium phaseoli TaxID=396 RepID=UPI000F7432D7|nr:hypothetical protein [Rhizobium phaseoli]